MKQPSKVRTRVFIWLSLRDHPLSAALATQQAAELQAGEMRGAGRSSRLLELTHHRVACPLRDHELDDAQSRRLLSTYAGELRDEDERALALMRFMSDFREAMWGVVQATVSELDVDFEAYASEHFDRLDRTAASSAFRAALEAA